MSLDLIRSVLAERREYRQGTRVINCALHMALPLTQRPSDCVLCWTDIQNQLSLAVSVNGKLNGWMDRIEQAVPLPGEGL